MCAAGPSIRLYVTADLDSGGVVDLSADQSRYLVQVMRRGVGGEVLLFNGRDGEWRASITAAAKKAVTVTCAEQMRAQYPSPDLHLYFAPVKKAPLDLTVQKATELGVSSLHPVLTERTVVRTVNIERLAAIAREAAEQCGRLDVPVIHEPVALTDAFTDWPSQKPLYVLDETGKGMPIARVLGDSDAFGAVFVTGPEGGFADSELDLLRALPFSTPLSLGPRILRAETAALAALVCWQALCGDWRESANVND